MENTIKVKRSGWRSFQGHTAPL